MKRVLLTAVMMTIVSAAMFANKIVAEGESFTPLGKYTIELADDPFMMQGEECKSYVISYLNSPTEVRVVICNGKNCKRYVVMSDQLAVQYVCNEYYFGVEKLSREFQADGLSTDDNALNRAEYFHQKVLGPGEGSELSNTRLIAAYFPMLVNGMAETVAMR